MISRQMAAEGVKQDRRRHRRAGEISERHRASPGVTVHHRDELDRGAARAARAPRRVGDDLRPDLRVREAPPAQEEHARRLFPDPAERVVINELVCEGCGDCSVKSNCLSVEPLETEFGRKRKINQSTCNKDYSCVNGFCPSFVTVEGGAAEEGPRSAHGGSVPTAVRSRRVPSLRRAMRLRNPRHRHRRHRRRHDRPDPRHGRAHGRQGRVGARHGRPRAEGRRGDVARADRADAGRSACDAHRDGRGATS